MVYTQAMIEEIVDRIDKAVLNPTTIHVLDENRVEQIFYDLFRNNRYNLGDITRIVSSLRKDYREYSRNRIFEIAESKLHHY